MLNRRAFVTTGIGAAALAACGRQVTPDPSVANGNNNLAGKMVIRFRVRGTLDFNNYNYVIAFNTSGTGGEPYPQAYLTRFTDFSYSFVIGALAGGSGVLLPTLLQYIIAPGTSNQLNPRPVPLGASTTQLTPYDSLAQNEFQLTFTREQLDNPLQFFASPTPAATATPSPTPTPSTGATATPAPTPSPAGFAPTNSPIPNATSPAQATWYVNFFTLDKTGTIALDSLGLGGPTDTSFVFTVDTSQQDLFPVFRPSGITGPSSLSAFIDGGEIDNYP